MYFSYYLLFCSVSPCVSALVRVLSSAKRILLLPMQSACACFYIVLNRRQLRWIKVHSRARSSWTLKAQVGRGKDAYSLSALPGRLLLSIVSYGHSELGQVCILTLMMGCTTSKAFPSNMPLIIREEAKLPLIPADYLYSYFLTL